MGFFVLKGSALGCEDLQTEFYPPLKMKKKIDSPFINYEDVELITLKRYVIMIIRIMTVADG